MSEILEEQDAVSKVLCAVCWFVVGFFFFFFFEVIVING